MPHFETGIDGTVIETTVLDKGSFAISTIPKYLLDDPIKHKHFSHILVNSVYIKSQFDLAKMRWIEKHEDSGAMELLYLNKYGKVISIYERIALDPEHVHVHG